MKRIYTLIILLGSRRGPTYNYVATRTMWQWRAVRYMDNVVYYYGCMLLFIYRGKRNYTCW